MTEIINIIIALSIVMVIKDCYESIKESLYLQYNNSDSKSRTKRVTGFVVKWLNVNKDKEKERYFKESAVSIEEFDLSES